MLQYIFCDQMFELTNLQLNAKLFKRLLMQKDNKSLFKKGKEVQ